MAKIIMLALACLLEEEEKYVNNLKGVGKNVELCRLYLLCKLAFRVKTL
jgi:hypothetical protein